MIVRKYEEQDAEAISSFMKRCFLVNIKDQIRSHEPEYYIWKYRKNPWGRPGVFVAEDDSKIVGLFCVIPKPLKIGEKRLIIGETGDAYIDPDYQGKGIFYRLVSLAFKEMSKQGITSYYTTANMVTMKIWTRLYGFKKIFEYRSIIAPVDFTTILKKAARLGNLSYLISWKFSLYYKLFYSQPFTPDQSSLRMEIVSQPDSRLEDAWRLISSECEFTIFKSREYFDYRFFNNPEKYNVYLLIDREAIAGYAVIKFTENFNIKCGHIVDLMLVKSSDENIRQAVGLSLGIIKDSGAALASSWVIKKTKLDRGFKKYGFLTRSKSYHLLLGGDVLKMKDFDRMNDPENWSFMHGDSDNV